MGKTATNLKMVVQDPGAVLVEIAKHLSRAKYQNLYLDRTGHGGQREPVLHMAGPLYEWIITMNGSTIHYGADGAFANRLDLANMGSLMPFCVKKPGGVKDGIEFVCQMIVNHEFEAIDKEVNRLKENIKVEQRLITRYVDRRSNLEKMLLQHKYKED